MRRIIFNDSYLMIIMNKIDQFFYLRYEEDEEPDLPAGLENLIAYMTGTIDSDPDDDGYSEKIISIRTVLKMCQKHVGTGYRYIIINFHAGGLSI